MTNSTIRIILDTNLWISYLISNALIELDDLFREKNVTLLFSYELIAEFVSVSQRPKFDNYFSKEDVIKLIENMDQYGELIQVTSAVDKCPDKKDNFLLELAKDGKADYLVTGDSDLLEMNKFENTAILRWREFLNKVHF